MGQLSTWVITHQELVFFLVIGVIANLAPRPHPEALSGWRKFFWVIIDRLCILTAQKVPGNLKWIFAASPSTKTDQATEVDLGEGS